MKFFILPALFLTVATLQAQTPYAPDENTLFLYHFDEDDITLPAMDASENGRHATFGPNVLVGQEALSGLGMSLMSTDNLDARISWVDMDKANGKDSFLYSLAEEDLTIEAWVKPTEEFANFTSGNRFLLVVQPDGVGQVDLSVSIHAADGKYYLAVGDKSGPNRVWTHTNPLEWEIGEWYHVAITIEFAEEGHSYYTFYVSKAGDSMNPIAHYTRKHTALEPQDEFTQQRTLEIGNYFGNYGKSFFPGQIDEVRISNIVRSEFETLLPPDSAQ